MNRRSLIKCILGLTAAPKILAEMDFKPPIVTKSPAYGQQIAKYIQSTHHRQSTNKYFYLRNERFKQTLIWANGKNDYAEFANQLQLKDEKI